MRYILLSLYLTFSLWNVAFTQEMLLRDEKAEELIGEGKRFLNYQQFARAAKYFDSAIQRPFNRTTTTAIYLSGLAYFYEGDVELARHKFQTLIDQFPKSRYIEDARYHRALLLVRSNRFENHSRGLKELLDLIDFAYSVGIAKDAYAATQNFLFYTCPIDYLEELIITSQPHHRLMVMEAFSRRRIENGKWEEAQMFYRNYLRRGGEDSPYLRAMFEQKFEQKNDRPSSAMHSGDARVALALPLFLDDPIHQYAEDIPQKTKSWLEFYEGFQLALAAYSPHSRKKIRLKIMDTQRDVYTTQQRVRELDDFSPNIIVGDIFNGPSEIISDWAESRGIPQIIPLSPTFDVSNKYQTFLAHPDLKTRAARMAEYAREVLGLKKVAVWTNQKSFTEIFSNSFIETFDTLGGEVVRIAVDSVYDRGEEEGAKFEIPAIVRKLRFEDIDGMYIPVNNEAIAGLIMTQVAFERLKIKIMGTSHWQQFERIDRELKEKYGVLFTNTSHYEAATDAYQDFFQDYLASYSYPPSEFCLLGYDLGMFLAKTIDLYDYSWGMPLSAYIRAQSEYEGIHLNYFFGGKQVNQFVNISEFHASGIRKVNGNQWRQWELLDDWRNIKIDSTSIGRRDEAYFLRKKREK